MAPLSGDAAVWGDANPLLGQIVTAKVILSTDESSSEFRKRMKKFCRNKLPKYKIPHKIIIASEQLHSIRFKKMRAVGPNKPHLKTNQQRHDLTD